ncbi:hypothetical protein cypCar_00034605 [Cyprinus carpio]|nr:hypothetical protein cypCar_00034605 [Cyprinus carpio]
MLGAEVVMLSVCALLLLAAPAVLGSDSDTQRPRHDSNLEISYSHVVENTAFFGDVALRFPRIVHHYYDRNADWSRLLRWGLRFCNQTGVFSGGAHQHVLTLVLHTAEAFQKILREEEKRRRKEEKRKEIRKGPRISRSRSEL